MLQWNIIFCSGTSFSAINLFGLMRDFWYLFGLERFLISFWRGIEYCHGESRYKITGKLKIKMPVTEVGEKDKLELSKLSNQSTEARKRQAEMTKIENPVNGIGEKDKLELSKSSNQSTETRGRQAGMTKMENPVTGIGEKGKI